MSFFLIFEGDAAAFDSGRDFAAAAAELLGRLTSALHVLTHERERLKLVMETAAETNSITSRNAPNAAVAGNGKLLFR